MYGTLVVITKTSFPRTRLTSHSMKVEKVVRTNFPPHDFLATLLPIVEQGRPWKRSAIQQQLVVFVRSYANEQMGDCLCKHCRFE